ncbi:hypothetical protein PPL_01883 [Heterostelium album PN500]|uniref:Uncharacterized protein n=1 Tax=Heterostelium pallidum (strain ATCC 26659 / Pp 5 / PN500) TaxID=670386 RepID=D3B0R6_HETP5|nr:hypothetical protein PPL_01883 [Heterostelium album PN500]EFA84890.1 hypothetical protein PPL_01883 [Heterostelium album PN500]|eukprot:XP_020437001.1 hypothetical protein PPL_01883 [Heterostelium album PN500]
MASVTPSIKRIIFHSYNNNHSKYSKTDSNRATGFFAKIMLFYYKMTTKEILDKHRLISNDELKKMKKNELKNLMVQYSITYDGLQKDLTKTNLLELISNYQEYIIDLRSRFITNNPIDKHHRGTVHYRIPTLIINRMIRVLWHHHIDLCLSTDIAQTQLRENYRWLLTIALVSKECFKLISSLFTRFKYIHFYTQVYSASPAELIRSRVTNPLSVLKNITHMTLSINIFIEIISFRLIEIELIFANVRKLCLHSNHIIREKQDKYCKTIVQYMPNLETLKLPNISLNHSQLESLKEIPLLTSLNLSFTSFAKFDFSLDMISSSIRRLKLPKLHDGFQLSDTHNLTTLQLFQLNNNMVNSQYNQISKLIIKNVNSTSIFKSLVELLCAPDCKVHTLYIDYGTWISEVLEKNRSITTLDIGSSLKRTFEMVSKSTTLRTFIFYDDLYTKNIYRKTGNPTGYAHIKSKKRIKSLLNASLAFYAKKIYTVSTVSTVSTLNANNDNASYEATVHNHKFLYIE